MATVTVRWLEGGEMHTGGSSDLARARAASCSWVDVLDADLETLGSIAAHYAMHPLSVEDCLHFPQRPKLDSYDGSLFLVWLTPHGQAEGRQMHEMDAFLGSGWLVTVHRDRLPGLESVAADAGNSLRLGADWALHSILDRLVDDVFPLVDQVSERLESLQDEMLQRASQAHLVELYTIRRELLSLHKAIAPERDALRALVRATEVISPEAYRYFQDVADHLARVEDTIDLYREVAASSMDVYLSAQSNRMNQVMKQLTIVATIFMPLTLITGIYGMNFRYFPELSWRFAYPGVLGAMLLIAVSMLLYFRRKEWW